jgi:hypothetical protein
MWFKTFGGVMLMALTITGLALAQVPPPPSNLTVLPSTMGATLQWDGSAGAFAYRVYKAVDTSTHFNRIATVQQTHFTDGMVPPGHTFRYYVTAINNAGESGPSNIVTYSPLPPVTGTVNGNVIDDSINLPIHGARIVFMRHPLSTTPSRVAFTDSMGNYSVQIDTGRYFLYASKMGYIGEWYDNAPDPQNATPVFVEEGATVTANFGLSPYGPPPPHVTGLIQGTVIDDSTSNPIGGVQIQFYRAAGMFMHMVMSDPLGRYSAVLDTGRYRIYANKPGYIPEWYDNSPNPQGATIVVVQEEDTVTANFGLSPYGPPVRGTIAGTVIHDSTSEPIARVQIRFFRVNGYATGRYTFTDSLGMYHAELDTGRYLVYATKFGFIPEFFDNARTPQEATPVVVTPNAVSTANFGLSPGSPTPHPMVDVSGTVTDSVTNQPIANALVAIVRTFQGVNLIQRLNGTPGGFPHEIFNFNDHGRMHGVVWRGFTDANGNYTGHVPQGGTYIVFSAKQGYFGEWFDNKRTPMEADRLTLHNDTSGIDFALSPNPLLQNSIAGTVNDTANNGIPSHVVLFYATTIGPQPYRHTMTDSVGNYSFNFIPGRLYYLKAFPVSGYAPAWYKAGAFGVEHWQDADTVRAMGNVTGINIGVVPTPEGGLAILAGRVTAVGSNASTSGAVVYAVSTSSQRILGFDIAEADGSFRIEGLAPGAYRLSVDKEGFAAANTVTCDVNANNNFLVTGLNVQITPSNPLTVQVDEAIPGRHELLQNYPNPFNPSTKFGMRIAEFGLVTLKVYNLLGQEVATLVNEALEAGTYDVTWNASGLSSGVYLYRLTAGNYTETKRLVLMK